MFDSVYRRQRLRINDVDIVDLRFGVGGDGLFGRHADLVRVGESTGDFCPSVSERPAETEGRLALMGLKIGIA